jgi:molybdopterin molybdotransferase
LGSTPGHIVSFEEALEIVAAEARRLAPLASQKVSLLASVGRVLAETIPADRDQPPFDRSTRDGFAVRAADLCQGSLRILGQVRAGEVWAEAVQAGQAVQIMTGAPMPAGTDAVLMVEHANVADGLLSMATGRTVKPGENVVPQGAEARLGAPVLTAGTLINAAEVALAANCGRSELSVFTRPNVAIVATGDELIEVAQSPAPQQIRNSNSYAIAAMVAAAGGHPHRLAIARDLREEIRARIIEGRTAGLLVFSGGVSMGDYDLVEEVLAEFGAEFLFTGVRMQPGKPVVFGRLPAMKHPGGVWPECPFFGLPGNPISTQVTFHCFAEPFVRALAGEGWVGPRWAQASLSEAISVKPALTRLLPARMDNISVRLVGWQGSGDLAANARANCYAELLPDSVYNAGDVVRILLR